MSIIPIFDILSGVLSFIGWGELTSSGNFRVFKHPFPVDEQLLTENPNDAVIRSPGWAETPSYCGITSFKEFIGYVSAGDTHIIIQTPVSEFKELVGLLKDGQYVFVITDEQKERRNA